MKNTIIEDAIDPRKKLTELGFEFPNGIVIVPSAFETATKKEDLMHEAEYQTVQKLFRASGIEVNSIQYGDGKIPRLVNQHFEWAGPLILFTSTVLSQQPEIVTNTVDIIIKYLQKKLRGVPKTDNIVKLSIITESQSGTFKKISYTGPVDGLADLAKIVSSANEEKNG